MTVLGDGGAHRTPLPQALHGRLSALKTRSMTAVRKAYAPCAPYRGTTGHYGMGPSDHSAQRRP